MPVSAQNTLVAARANNRAPGLGVNRRARQARQTAAPPTTAPKAVSPTDLVFATPPDPAWPVVKLSGSGFPLTVADNGGTALSKGARYSNWNSLDDALADVAPVIADLPAGELGGSLRGGCADIEWRGQVDASGYPLTGISTADFYCPTRADRLWTVKNLRFGPTDAQLMTNPRFQLPDNGNHGQILFRQGGRLNIINVRNRNSRDNGIASSAEAEWLNRRTGEIWVYDTDNWGHGANSDHHNIYVHALKTFAFIRSLSRDTGGAHELKTDSDKVIVLDSVLAHVTYPGSPGVKSESAVMNITRSQQYRVARSLIVNNTGGSGLAFQVVARANANGGFSTRTPPIFDIGNDPGFIRLGKWLSNPDGRESSTEINGRTYVEADAGAGSIIFFQLSPHAAIGPKITLSTRQTYTVRVYRDDDTVQEFTAAPTASPYINPANGKPVPGSAVFPVPGNLGFKVSRVQPVMIKRAADSWDKPLLNSQFWNRNDPNYWWKKIKSGAVLDLTKQQDFDEGYVEDTLIITNTPNISSVFWIQPTWQHIYWGSPQYEPEVPVPPLNNPTGPTMAWPDLPGASTWAEPLAGPGYPLSGRDPSGFVSGTKQGPVSDAVWPWPLFVADDGMWVQPGGPPARQFQLAPLGATLPRRNGFVPDVRWLDANGNLVQVASSDANPIPSGGQTTLKGPHAAGATMLAVASARGCTKGEKLQMALPLKPGAAQAIFISTVTDAPSGTSISVTDPLPRAAADGAAMVCFPHAGTRPATWISPSNYALQ